MENFDLFISSLTKLVAFESVKNLTDGVAPFGKDVKNALRFVLDLAKSFGFDTVNYDDYFGEIIVGEGEEIGIIGHVDVVPAGDGWDSHPFTLTKKGDLFYGRGVMDDKGPLLLALFAIKALIDDGVKFNKKIRFFVGTDEECGWEDVAYFKTKSHFPVYGFSPDGNFPVSYAEKGILRITFKIPPLKNFYDIKGGTVINAVCGLASARVRNGIVNDALARELGLKVDGDRLISVGKSCHGSHPEQGVNAFKALFEYFERSGEDVAKVNDFVFGDKKGLERLVNEQGTTTLSANLVVENQDGLEILCDCRVPAPLTEKDVEEVVAGYGLNYEICVKRNSMCCDKNGKFVRTLLNAYNEATGEKGEPVSQSGGTFAYVFEKGCAFGPEYENFPSSIHEANECVSTALLEKTYAIYKKAIADLVK